MDLSGHWLIVEEGANPSSDYFILPFLTEAGVSWERVSLDNLPSEEKVLNCNIVFIRYVNGRWKSFVNKNIDKIGRVCIFIDDDLFDWRALSDMPLRYQSKIYRLSWSKQSWLKSINSQLLVSSTYLKKKYSFWAPVKLCAKPLVGDESRNINIFYHGSASHKHDILWLRPIINEVMAINSKLTFEIIGDSKVNRLFNHLPRVQVLHPMKWPTYLTAMRSQHRTIGLAPLLDTPFNRARSHTKFFDITQAGAVGIYAAGDIYGKVIRHGENGLLLPMNRSQWIDGILSLAEDHVLRENMLTEARKCL